VRSAGPTGPNRLGGPLRPEPACRPLHAAGARCCAPGAAWLAPDVLVAGHGTAGPTPAPECAAYRRARGRGWRLAGRGLVSGGFLLCGWLVTGAGHAYAAQVTAPAAPHEVLSGIGTSSSLAGPDAGQAGQLPAPQLPASAPLAVPSFPGDAGAGAGNHNPAGPAAASAAALSRAAAQVGPAGSGRTVPLTSALAGPSAPGGAAATPGVLAQARPGAHDSVVAIGRVAPRLAQSGTPGAAAALGRAISALAGSGARGAAAVIGRVAPRLAQSGMPGAAAALGRVISALARSGAPGQVTTIGTPSVVSVSPPLVVPQSAQSGAPPVATVRPSPGHLRTRAHVRAGAAPRTALRPAVAGPGLGDPALPGHSLAGAHRGTGSHARRASARHRGGLPADRLGPGAAAQADPASPGSGTASGSGGGAGSGQLAAQAPPGAGPWTPSARLIRIRASRWPAGFVPADDPAVSPD
jgi:hypothetical protein